MKNYIVATIKDWNIAAYKRNVHKLVGNWHLVTDMEGLDKIVDDLKPEYIFFPHWSWVVPERITNRYECVCFHMTDVPYGRGGSPLQNLITRGHKNTRLTAIKMVQELDAGPVYTKTELSLAGSAQEIFKRASEKTYELINYIVKNQTEPYKQEGEVVIFSRRTPEQSGLPTEGELNLLYDHIRMLDAESYPKAFLEVGNLKFIFEEAQLTDDSVNAKVIIKKRD